MSTDKRLSVNYYKYLCQKIGSEEDVKVKRLAYIIQDIGTKFYITSGSKGEGLDLRGSDLDIMNVASEFKVYESDRNYREAIFHDNTVPLIMDTDNTPPCFTLLRFLNNIDEQRTDLKQIVENDSQGSLLSNELYKMYYMNLAPSSPMTTSIFHKMHGPCLSDKNDIFDIAYCLKCDQWIFQAQPWIYRPRTTWPPVDIISKITSCGVLFVPIGLKGSCSENLQWRISFSVAEKFLIFSFSHTQLLCYALLKIFLKEIVEKCEDLKGLLCSYFLKTLMFWISEESNPSVWRPNNIIPCFMACLKRLLYCVEYEALLHYFIPDNNLFYLRFNVTNKDKLITILINSYKQGIQCFKYSETLNDYKGLTKEVDLMKGNFRIIFETLELNILFKYHSLIYNFLHNSKTVLSRDIFTIYLSRAHQVVPQKSQNQLRSNNKQKYYKYRRDLSHLVIGTQSDALSGWLLLASFFYVHKNYLISSDIIYYALSKCTDDKELYPIKDIQLNQNQKSVLNFMNREKINIAMKLITVRSFKCSSSSSLVPQELQLMNKQSFKSLNSIVSTTDIAFQMMEDTNKATRPYQCPVNMNDNNSTSATSRLSSEAFQA
ncbi:Hypothetical predicted protein [Mytilus galloprovincialis]|uniref:Mab-21-like HhH/H2TH-like domain-containing protein n=1 Tax=Mytilus galloprovincialis TaxID=29158 RepID=A0A8B6HPL9_MYTGA|nr:Hypothetical predicted protein [Mytilus galloprovincialis]